MTLTSPFDQHTALDWIERWDRQQEGYVYGRERVFDLTFEVIERLAGAPGRLLDLAAGPGALASRAGRRFPDAELLALDIDPVLVELGRRGHGERIRWFEADLRLADWHHAIEPGSVDVVMSATALHYLDAHHLPHVAAGIAQLLRPGGVFVDCDTMRSDPGNPRIAELTEQLRRESWEQSFADGKEDFGAWWQALEAEPGWQDLFAERDRRFGPQRHGTESAITERVAALRAAGFVEVDTIAQDLDKHVLVAIAP
jgi:SAM-dependent methyltransferase